FMRFLAFIPILLFVIFYLMNSYEDGFITEASTALGYIKNNSIDFFFFLSAFLLTSHALREYKYNNSFSLRQYFVRRSFKITPLIIPLALFAFFLHPFITRILQLSDVTTPGISNNFLLTANNIVLSPEQFIYYGVLWIILLFICYYLILGFILKFMKDRLNIISYLLITIGMADRAFHVLENSNHEFDLGSYGIAIGFGILAANYMRNEQRMVDYFKETAAISHFAIYAIGVVVIFGGYLFFSGTYLSILVPVLSSLVFSYVVFEQTYSKHSLFKFRKLKQLSKIGRMSYGQIVYLSMVAAITIIAMDSLELRMEGIGNQLIFCVVTVILTMLVARFSYNYIERPILNMKREFKKT
ncbi:MAG: acyltransferase family protein, partial [Crocinitomicaceae bacterium]